MVKEKLLSSEARLDEAPCRAIYKDWHTASSPTVVPPGRSPARLLRAGARTPVCGQRLLEQASYLWDQRVAGWLDVHRPNLRGGPSPPKGKYMGLRAAPEHRRTGPSEREFSGGGPRPASLCLWVYVAPPHARTHVRAHLLHTAHSHFLHQSMHL